MTETARPMTDRHLDATTVMSCKREPACFAYLCANAVSAPIGIEKLNFDIASADYHGGRATVWATLDMRADGPEPRVMALLGFDESFLRPFTRAVLEAAATRLAHRMTIVADDQRGNAPRVVDYVRTHGGTPLHELVITPYDQILSVSAAAEDCNGEDTLFQLPRTDSFLRMLARMTHVADMALRDTLHDMERLGGGAVDKDLSRALNAPTGDAPTG